MKRSIVETLTLLSLLFLFPVAAHAALERVGPVVPAHGYPAWYQDASGLVLEFCDNRNPLELAGSWCLLVPADVPGMPPATSETFPGVFADEHFYWAAGATFDVFGDPQNAAILTLGLEAAFASGPVIAGDQITFGRVRIVVKSLPFAGTYTVYTPYGVYVFADQAAGDKLFFTEDIGVGCPPGQFDCALASKLGPFLLPSTSPGGPELPPIPLLQPLQDPIYAALIAAGIQTTYPGNSATQTPKYIADPARVGPVTGSPLPPFTSPVDGVTRNHNIFRVEGPVDPATGQPWVAETYDFSLMGRVFEGAIPGRVIVNRASYTVPVSATNPVGKVDVFATGFSATQARLPAAPPPQATPSPPVMRFWDAPCAADAAGTPSGPPPPGTAQVHQMFAAGSNYWGQAPLPTIPPEVCVETNAIAGGQPVSVFYAAPVTDEVTVTQALYDPGTTVLSVNAASSDLPTPRTLTLTDFGDLLNGQFLSTQLPAPATVRVVSSAGGVADFQASTGVGATTAPTVPVAANDMVTTGEDAPLPAINVLVNDTLGGLPIAFGAGVIVEIATPPRLGGAVVNADGTIAYTPAADRYGTDGLAYRVSVDGGITFSNIAGVTVLIAPVNDPPVAVNDTAVAFSGQPIPIDVAANDTDPDGTADIVAVGDLTQPTDQAGSLAVDASVAATGKVVTFTAATPGTYAFAYRVQDAAGVLSANAATVTVTVAGAETITVASAVFRTDAQRWIVSGADTVPANQTLTIAYNNGPNAGFVVGTAVVDAAGNWLFDVRGVSGLWNPTLAQATQIVVTSPFGAQPAIGDLTVRR